MESWRERGFVPDSDDEDEEVDGQETFEDTGNGQVGIEDVGDVAESIADRDEGRQTGQVTTWVEEKEERELLGKEKDGNSGDDVLDETTKEKDHVVTDTDKRSEIVQVVIPPERHPAPEQKSQELGSPAPAAEPAHSSAIPDAPNAKSPSTPKANESQDIWDVPESSPDEIQFDFGNSSRQATRRFVSRPESLARSRSPQSSPSKQRARHPATRAPATQSASQLQSQSTNQERNPLPPSSFPGQPTQHATDEGPATQPVNRPASQAEIQSHLSSPPLSIRSLNLDDVGRPPPAAAQEHMMPPPDDELDDLIPPLDVPEEVLQELSHPMRRSMRQRNPIQLHPYLLEDAKYQELMKTRGVRPVRMSRYQQELQAAANESQNQDFANAQPSSSPQSEPEVRRSPVDRRPEAERRLQWDTPIRQTEREPHRPNQLSTGNHPRTYKRRKISHANTHRDELSRCEDNDIASGSLNDVSIFEIRPSPPRSVSASSAYEPNLTGGFRFPRGFVPPALATPVTESRLQSTDDANAMVWSGQDEQRPVDAASVSSQSESDSDEEEESNEQVQQYRRRIRGVLPASWLRLDQKKQEDRTNAAKQQHEARRPEHGKGVAKRVRPTNRTDSRRDWASLMDFVGSEDEDEPNNDSHSVTEEARRALADLVGFDDPYQGEDVGDDIPEDNRIDYMFPGNSRGPQPGRRKNQGAKRPRPERDEVHSGSTWKRPRLKRQTRITDPQYGGQKAKMPSKRSGRPAVLDAPDVAQRARKEQAPFLRVAARQARFRQQGSRRSRTLDFSKLKTRNTPSSSSQRRAPKQQSRLTQPRPRESRQPLMDISANGQLVPDNQVTSGADEDRMTSRPDARPGENSHDPASASDTNPQAAAPETRDNASSSRPGMSQRLGNKWVIPRNLAISSLKRNTPRTTELEDVNSNARPALFQNSLAALNRDYRQQKSAVQTRRPNLPLDRYLSESATPGAAEEQPALPRSNTVESGQYQAKAQSQLRHRQLKKRPPKRLNPDAAGRQKLSTASPQDPEPLAVEDDELPRPFPRRSSGLTGFQVSYSTDFNIAPLLPGTFFHESTFLGSGEFSRLQKIQMRDLDKDADVISINLGDKLYRWGPWNECVSSELGLAFERLSQEVERSNTITHETDTPGCGLYRSLVKYVTDHLTFIDPVDRTAFVTKAQDFLRRLNDQVAAYPSSTAHSTRYLIRLCSHSLVLAAQTYHVASHGLVGHSVRQDTLDLVHLVARQLCVFILGNEGLADIRQFLRDNDQRDSLDAGIHDDHPSVEAFAIAQLLLRHTDEFKGGFENIVTETLQSSGDDDLTNTKDVRELETRWHGLFTILPLSEIDQFGIAQVGSRFKEPFDNWKAVQWLLNQVLDDYEGNSSRQPSSYINYCRVLFRRCFHLIKDWAWRDCKLALETIYDFFARRTLYNLAQEECFGSPDFLEDLDRDPSLTVTPRDSCFHIFLKITGCGLRFMSKSYEKKKIRNFAWRLLPNHGRVYPKEMPLRREDLDALRNHNDLLCTLYWAVPDGCRPRLEAIKNLVDPASSHRETCKISLRSWMRLVRFKLSTDEDASGLDAFADWHSYFVNELLKQHSHARTEVEAQSNADHRFSNQVIERTISNNQQQIESLLSTALGGLQSAVQLSRTIEHARRLVSKTPIKTILGLFNPKHTRVNSIVSDALRVIQAYIRKSETPSPTTALATDDDSQEYGDWKEIFGQEDSQPNQGINQGIEHVQDVFYPAVSRLVSNSFGEDQYPGDGILLDALDCWTSIARTLVQNGLRHWDSYLNQYDSDSWTALRSTMQVRKFTPQFLASCIEKDNRFLSNCKEQVYEIWLSTLVERGVMLKFQHRLTEALLNHDSDNPLLKNLPFFKHRKDDRYSISLEEFNQRRLSLISSLLSNMREHVQGMEDTDGWKARQTRQEYKELIQKLMSSMKSSYQALGKGVESAQGSYVDFVHCIVGFLQQHTRDISAIDPFFMDPKSFPLPSGDPRYIVAKLKSYEPKLLTEKAAKPLIGFIQGVSERATMDGEQVYLVGQLHESMANTYEAGDLTRPTLRAFLLQCAFPAYLEVAFKHPAAWILARPILQVISLIFKDLLLNMDTTDSSCLASVVNIFTSVFQASYQAFQFISDDPDKLKKPYVLVTLAAFIEMVISSLPIIEYIDRATDVCGPIIHQVQAFRQFTLFALSRVRDLALPYGLEEFTRLSSAFTTSDQPAPAYFSYLRQSASRELHTYISEKYSRHRGKYYFTRRGASQPDEIRIEPSLSAMLENGPGTAFEDAVRTFWDHLQQLDLFAEAD